MAVVRLANGHGFAAPPGISILDAALAQGIVLEHSCRTGRCGSCKARVVAGRSSLLRDEQSLSADELEAGWILTCVREACGDLALDAEDLFALVGISATTLPCRIDALELVASDVLRVTLRLPPAAKLKFVAGQYLDVVVPGAGSRSYSMANGPTDASRVELHIRQVPGGVLSAHWFERARRDDLLRLRGPRGTFFLRDVAGLDLVFLATGTGYAPVQSMLRQLRDLPAARRPASVSLFWGGRTEADLYADPVRELEGLRHTRVLSRAGADWSGARGHVQDVLVSSASSLGNVAVYACGSDAMVHSARRTLESAGLSPRRFFAEAFVSAS